jgi:hypothetical protein
LKIRTESDVSPPTIVTNPLSSWEREKPVRVVVGAFDALYVGKLLKELCRFLFLEPDVLDGAALEELAAPINWPYEACTFPGFRITVLVTEFGDWFK